jgi:hypothetical protein
MPDIQIRKVLLLNENKDKIESLKSLYTADEIVAAQCGATNAYSQALADLQAKREAIYAMPNE